ncbi:MAG: hypothetical protein IMW89_19780, partial [Ktedonobacteraceae bacterium]|nr:hypothetical protein [Ktedonobacteraceae bacterium]
MPSPEDLTRTENTVEQSIQTDTDELADFAYTPDALVIPAQQATETSHASEPQTEPFSYNSPPHRPVSYRSILNERRQNILQQKQIDADTRIDDATGARAVWRQVIHLRAENRYLRHELEEQQRELQQITQEYNNLQSSFDKEVAIIHNGYKQEIAHYQEHLQQLVDERDRLQEVSRQAEARYQELYHAFQTAVEEEVHKRLIDTANTASAAATAIETRITDAPTSSETPAGQGEILLQDAGRTERATPAGKAEDRYLLESLFLKHEIQVMAEQLRQARQQLDAERQKLAEMQYTARQQAELRQQTLQARIKARWKV